MTESSSTATADAISFAPGSPCWVDVSSADPQAAAAFYSGLFGWTATDLGADAGGYIMFKLEDRVTAAVGALQEGQHPAWSVYFRSTDADETSRKVEAAGGKVVVPAFDVMDQGRMAVYQDPSNAIFSIWQAAEMPGLGVKDLPNTFSWCELNTNGVAKAVAFYPAVFGWSVKSTEATESAPAYAEWQIDGRSIGGCIDTAVMGEGGASIPPYWLVYFTVTDIDAAARRVVELGGEAKIGPMEYPGGKFLVSADPTGAVFGVLQGETSIAE